ncbi:leucinerich repeat kinase [Pelomyxa schiedti]|nr:leucinerich repeat kinase [Pelomyxa schiedti]
MSSRLPPDVKQKIASSPITCNLSAMKFGDECVSDLIDKLKAVPTLTALDLSKTQLTVTGAVNVLAVLKYLRGMKSISFSNIKLGTAGVVAITTAMRQPYFAVTTLCLSGTSLDNESMEALVQGLKIYNKIAALDLSGNCFTNVMAICDAISSLPTLHGLDLSNNNINDTGLSAIAEVLKRNNSLKILHVAGNEFTKPSVEVLADAMAHNVSITALNLAFNKMDSEAAQAVATLISVNKTVQVLDISRNFFGDTGIVKISDALKYNTSLKTLELSYNQFASAGAIALADAIRHNVTLTYLDISDTRIGDVGVSALSKAMKHNTVIKTIKNNVTSLLAASDWISISNIVEQNSALPTTAKKCVAEELSKVQSPPYVCEMKKCLLSVVPPEIFKVKGLTKLHLSHNLLCAFPIELTELTCLNSLDLSYNHIPVIPDSILKLVSLTSLNLQNNVITQLPLEFGSLPSITMLNFSHNELERLPYTLVTLFRNPKVEIIFLNNRYVIPETVLHDTDALCRYLEEQATNSTVRWTTIKLVLVGKENVGKTTILRRLQGKRHDGYSTDGVEVSNLVLQDISFSAFDFGGQSIFFETHQFFLTGRSLYMVIFNCTTEDYRNSIEHWLQQIANCRGLLKPPILLVGTHADKLPSSIPQEELQNRLLAEYKNRKDLKIEGVLLLSAVQPPGSSDPLITKLIGIATTYNMLRMQVPSRWVSISQVISDRRQQGHKVLSWKDYLSLASSCGVEDPSKAKDAVKFLHEVGSLLHFDDATSDLASLVVIDPNYLASVCSTIVTFKSNLVRDGRLVAAALPLLWKSFPPASHATMLSLLEKFNILYPLDRSLAEGKNMAAEYLVPCLLPINEPSVESDALWPATVSPHSFQQHSRRFLFQSVPMGLMGRLLARILHLPQIGRTIYWRNGIVLSSKSESTQLVKVTFKQLAGSTHELTILCRVPKGQKPALLVSVLHALENSLNCFYSTMKSSIHQLVACPECPAPVRATDTPQSVFSREEIVISLTNGESVLQCSTRQHAILIYELLPELELQKQQLIPVEELVIEGLIGQGGFGKVYRGTWKEHKIAVKELIQETDTEDFDSFYSEASIMCSLKCDYLLKLYGVCLQKPLRMILELAELGDLYKILTQRKDLSNTHPEEEDFTFQVSWDLRFLITLEVAKGLQYLHQLKPHPILHRDLRSPNIFLFSLDLEAPIHAKLADFGLATWVLPDVAGTVGAWQWMAPETNKPGALTYTLNSDMYSLGMVMYEIAARCKPYDELWEVKEMRKGEGLNELKIRSRVLEGLRPTFPPSTPHEFTTLAQQLWAHEPRIRPPASQAVAVLATIVANKRGLQISAAANLGNSGPSSETTLESSAETSRASLSLGAGVVGPTANHLLCGIPEPTPQEILLSGKSAVEPDKGRRVTALLFDTSDERVWCGCDDGFIIIFAPLAPYYSAAIRGHASKITSMALSGGLVWCGSTVSPILSCVHPGLRTVGSELPVHPPKHGCKALATVQVGDFTSVWSASETEPAISVCDTKSGTLSGKVLLDKEHAPLCLVQSEGSHLVCVGSRGSILLVNAERLMVMSTISLSESILPGCGVDIPVTCSCSKGKIVFFNAGPYIVACDTSRSHLLGFANIPTAPPLASALMDSLTSPVPYTPPSSPSPLRPSSTTSPSCLFETPPSSSPPPSLSIAVPPTSPAPPRTPPTTPIPPRSPPATPSASHSIPVNISLTCMSTAPGLAIVWAGDTSGNLIAITHTQQGGELQLHVTHVADMTPISRVMHPSARLTGLGKLVLGQILPCYTPANVSKCLGGVGSDLVVWCATSQGPRLLVCMQVKAESM